MAYLPIEPVDLGAGMAGNATEWSTLIDNHAFVYSATSPPIATAQTDIQVASAAGVVTVAEIIVPQNEDNEAIRVLLRWSAGGGGGTATCECDLSDDSYTTNDTASTTTTSATETDGLVSIPLSSPNTAGSSTPRTLRVKLSIDTGTATITAICVHYAAATAATGTLASGFQGHHSGWYTSGQPVPSEVCSRLMDAPALVASDRPVGLVTVIDDIEAGGSRARHSTSSTALVSPFFAPADWGWRKYRIAVRISRDGTVSAHSATVFLGPYEFTTTATGLTQWTQLMDGKLMQDYQGIVGLAVTGGTGNVYLNTLQIMREPAA